MSFGGTLRFHWIKREESVIRILSIGSMICVNQVRQSKVVNIFNTEVRNLLCSTESNLGASPGLNHQRTSSRDVDVMKLLSLHVIVIVVLRSANLTVALELSRAARLTSV